MPGFRSYLFLSFLLNLVQISAHSLDWYQEQARSYNLSLRENIRAMRNAELQRDLSIAPLRKPQLSLSADYLFAPFFHSNGRFIEVTPNPSSNAYGYDPALSNGGLYALQLNSSYALIDGGSADALMHQSAALMSQLQNTSEVLTRSIDKTVADQFVAVWSLEQQLVYVRQIINTVIDRKGVVEQLVQKGLMQQNDYMLLDIEEQSRRIDAVQLQASLVDAMTQLRMSCGIRDTAIDQLPRPEIQLAQAKTEFQLIRRFATDSALTMIQQELINARYRLQLNGFANVGLNGSDIQTISHAVGMSAGVHMSLGLSDGGQKALNEQIIDTQMQSLRNTKDVALDQLRQSLDSYAKQIDLLQTSMSLLDKQIKSQSLLLDIIRDKVIIGQVSVTDYLVALQDYAAAGQKRVQTDAAILLLLNQYNYLNW